MDWDGRCIRVCAATLMCAGLLRLSASGVLAPLGQALENPDVASFLVYMQTGRVVRLHSELPPKPTIPDAPTVPIAAEAPPAPVTVPANAATQPELPVFSAEDFSAVDITYDCNYEPDMEALLSEKLDWDLHTDEPSILIMHTHTTESYTPSPGDTYEETSAYRTLDPAHNVLSLGELITNRLEEAGIHVLHDTAFHDYPSYNGSYSDAAASTEKILEENPQIQLVLDLHRDAADTPTGQMSTECSIGSETAAQLMLVVGTDAGGLENPGWKDNLSVALKLHTLLERENPGICRPMNFTYHRYNQHLGKHALLIEIGAAGNTLPQAKLAANALADAIIALSNGTSSPN